MADIKISELGAASAVNATDLFPMTSSGVTVKATAQQIKNYMGVGNLTDLDTTDKSSLVGAIDEVNTKVSKTEVLISNSGDAFDPTKPYKVGELCIYNNTLYRCITACSAGSWATNQSCFTQDTLVDVTSKVTSDFSYSNSASINSNWSSSTGTWEVVRKGKIVQIKIDLKFLEIILMGGWLSLRILPSWAKPLFTFAITVILPDGQKGIIEFRKDDNYVSWFGYETVNSQSYDFYHTLTYLVDDTV